MRFIKSISLMILVIFSITNINYANAAEIITDDEQYNNLTELLDNYQEENPTGDLAVEKEINVSDISIVPEYEPSDNEISTFSFSIINSNGRNTITTRDYARQQLGDGTRLQAAYDTVLSYLEDVHNDNVDFDSYYDGIKQDADRRNVEVYLLKSLNMTSFGIDRTELKKVVDSVKYDHPEFFWLSSSFFYCGYLDSFTQQGLVWIPVVPKNYCTRKMRSDMREKIDEAMDEYRGLISDDMSDYEKEKIIHDKIINDTVYDPNLNRANESINDHNIAGVFIDHVAVCEGYARAMQILLNEACIDNIYVVGRSHNEGHAWNQVKIGDSYYNLDSTWDDTGDNKYRYFNVPDSLFDDHTAFTTSSSQYLYNIKSCNSNSAYNYLSSDDVDYFFNIDSTDVGELTNDNMKLFLNAKLKDALNNNKFDIIFMCQDEPMCQSLYSYYKNNTNTSSNPQRTIFDSELSQKIVDLSGHFPNVSSYGKMLRFKFTPKSDYETKIQSITIPDEINLDSKDSYFINQLIAPINANNKNLTWRSSNEGVVRIYNGILSPIASGDSLITCTSTDGSSITSNTCTVHVSIVNKPVESIELPEREITLSNIGETKKIQAIVNPSDASNGVLQWTSSNDRINVSDNGTVTACTNGNIQSTITCKTTDGTNISKSCIVKINYDGTRDYIDTITMNQDHINLSVNSTKNLRDNIELNSSIDPNTAPLKWASSDYNIAQIDEDTGEIKGISEGEATITCTANDRVTGSDSEGWRRVSASCTVNVVRNEDNVLVNSITVSPESVTLTALGETKTLTKTIEPDNATDTSVRWTSSDTGVATVTQSGVVKAMANGTAVITCKAKDGSEKTGQCTITVDIPESSESTDVKVNSITVSPASVTLTSSGETKNLAATIEPSNATDTSVNWTSSNIGVATVTQSGVVTAVSNGTAVITCEAQDGSRVKSTCTVTVGISQSTGTIAKCSITGTERVGKILRVQVKDSDGKVVKKDLNYKWYRLDDKDSTTGKEVEDESSYKVKSSDKGEYIKVVVTDSSGNEVQDITGKIKKREVDDDDDDDDNNSSNSSLSTGNNSNTNTNNSINNVNSNVNNTASGYVQSQNQNGSWQQINGTWRLIQTGSQTGNQQISSQSITSGSYKWQQLNGKWYLSDSSNHKLTGWQKVDNSWYLIGPSGDMATGWQIVSGKWYYLKENGQMTTGWQDVNGSWYYMNSDGSMATNTTIDGYRLNDRGQVVY